jgi:hypothetical protein
VLRKVLFAGLLLLVFILVWLLAAPSPIDPVVYVPPPPPPMTGVLAPNDLLHRAERLALGKVRGPPATGSGDIGCLETSVKPSVPVRGTSLEHAESERRMRWTST